MCALFDVAARAEEQRDHVGVRAFLAKEKPNFEVVSAAHSQTGAAGPA